VTPETWYRLDASALGTTIHAIVGEPTSEIHLLQNRVTDAIARYRKLLFIGIAVLYLIGFNGRWRLGRDTAEYRGLALNIADGKGYTFGFWAPKQVYPGLPYLLAGIEKWLGPEHRKPSLKEDQRLIGPSAATTVSVLVMLAMAGLTLVVTYRLMRLHYATWIATTITCGVATNAIFISHANELLTDVPFLLGIVCALYGWDLLRRAPTLPKGIVAGVIAIAGVALAACMRPTFWVLAIAWVAVCIWGFIRGPRRFYGICLTILLAIGLARYGFHPLSGGREREARREIPLMLQQMPQQIYAILHDDIPAAVFGEQLAPASILASLLLLGSGYLLFRRHPLWTLLVYGTVGATLLMSTESRYYMMVLPIFLLGWLVMTCALAARLSRKWGELVLLASLALVTLNNLSASVSFFVEQRSSNFLKAHRKGEFVPVLAMCEQIRKHVKHDQKVIGPSGAVMSVFSGRHVLTQREFCPNGPSSSNPRELQKAKVSYAVFPPNLYEKKEPVIAGLMRKRILAARTRVATVGKSMRLATVKVTVPDKDWRKLKRPLRKSATTKQASTRPASKPSTKTTRPAASSQAFRATTTMLSPVFSVASGAVLSGVPVYGKSVWILDTAAAMCGPGSDGGAVSFFIPKYSPTTGFSRPTALSPWISVSRSFIAMGSCWSSGVLP
jgi:hypothetical protein